MKAFISYQYGSDLSQVYQLLKNHQVTFFDGLSDITYEKSLRESILNAIKGCDFVVVVYAAADPNIAFEVGIAAALKKPVFAILTTSDEDFPDFIVESVHVFATPTEYDKLKFAFDIFIKKLKPKKRKYLTENIRQHHRDPATNDWVEIYENIIYKNEIALESFVHDLLSFYKLEYVQRRNEQEVFLADFCVWSDALNNSLGNPILIEVKKELNHRNALHTQTEIKEALEKSNAQSGIILYDQLIADNSLINSSRTPNVLCISFRDLLNKLKDVDINTAILQCRNELMHKSF